MTRYLLDVNVLVALLWEDHVHHDAAHLWFAGEPSRLWATCPFIQAGVVRLLTNPAVVTPAVSVTQAMADLGEVLASPEHEFWADEWPFCDLVETTCPGFRGHQQTSDAYLLGLVARRGGKLATLDRRIQFLLQEPTAAEALIEQIEDRQVH